MAGVKTYTHTDVSRAVAGLHALARNAGELQGVTTLDRMRRSVARSLGPRTGISPKTRKHSWDGTWGLNRFGAPTPVVDLEKIDKEGNLYTAKSNELKNRQPSAKMLRVPPQKRADIMNGMGRGKWRPKHKVKWAYVATKVRNRGLCRKLWKIASGAARGTTERSLSVEVRKGFFEIRNRLFYASRATPQAAQDQAITAAVRNEIGKYNARVKKAQEIMA